VRARGRGGKKLTGRSTTNGRGTEHVEIKRDLAIKTKRHANRRAQAQKDLQREHAFSGQIVLLPDFGKIRPDVRDTVEVLNVTKLFSGSYVADEVEHSFAPGQLETRINLYRDVCDCEQALKMKNPNDPCYRKCSGSSIKHQMNLEEKRS